MKRQQLWTTGLILLFFLSGCSVISRDLRMKSDPLLTFEQVSPYPAHYAGEIVIWGGYIIENKADQNRTSLTILQTPLSFNQEPQTRDKSLGRFMVLSDQYLDPEVYAKGRAVTIAGKIADFTHNPEDDEYGTYPVLHLQEIHLWEYRYRDPYYDPYYRHYPYYPRHHDPYFYDSSFHLFFGL